MHSMLVVQRRERSSGDESSERYGKNVSSIQDGYSCSDFLARVEHAQNVQRTGVERRFDKAEEETHEHQSSVVLDKCRESCYTAPD
jgi:hypothetical protein